MASNKKLEFIVDANTTQAQRSVETMSNNFSGLATKMKLAFAGVGLAVGKFGYDSMKIASDFGEAQNAVQQAFGKMGDSVTTWVEKNSSAYGMNKAEMEDTIGLFGVMGKSMGVAQKQNITMTQEMVKRMADLGSFYNKSNEEVATALKGVYTGEGEALKDLGVIMTEDNLIRYAQEKGIKKSYKEMAQAEKVALRYKFVMEMTKSAQGDFNRTLASSYPNQVKQLKATWENLQITIGKKVLPFVLKIVQGLGKAVKSVMSWEAKNHGISNTFGAIAKVISIIWTTASRIVQAIITWVSKSREAQSIIATIVSVAKNVWSIFKSIWTIVDKLAQWFGGWPSVFNAIGGAISAAFAPLKWLATAGSWIFEKISGLFGGGSGGSAKKHAAGGRIGNAGGMHVFGEAGPEMMVNAGDGYIANRNQIKDIVKSAVGNTNVYVDGNLVGKSMGNKVMRNGTTDLYYH